MMETAILVSQICTTASLAAWITTGVRDNIFKPMLNETYTAEVLSMARMRDEYPEAFAEVAHRAINDRKLQRTAFYLVVAVEFFATVMLWIGTIALVMALVGTATGETARSLALYGTTAFCAVWAGMLIVGNYFNYWFGHEGAQNTHFQLTLWGLGTSLLLIVGG